jgi:hypothetical protein
MTDMNKKTSAEQGEILGGLMMDVLKRCLGSSEKKAIEGLDRGAVMYSTSLLYSSRSKAHNELARAIRAEQKKLLGIIDLHSKNPDSDGANEELLKDKISTLEIPALSVAELGLALRIADAVCLLWLEGYELAKTRRSMNLPEFVAAHAKYHTGKIIEPLLKRMFGLSSAGKDGNGGNDSMEGKEGNDGKEGDTSD